MPNSTQHYLQPGRLTMITSQMMIVFLAVYDEEDNLIQEATEFEVAVEQFESKSEDGEAFFLEKTNELTGMRKFIEDHGRDGDW